MNLLIFIPLLISSITFSYGNSLTLIAEDSWPPFSLKDGSGFSTEIIRSAFKTVGVIPNIKVSSYAKALKLTKSGKVNGCYNVTRQKSTEKTFLFGKEPLLKARASFFYKKGKKFYKNFNELPDGYKVGLISGYEYGDNYEKHRHRFKEVRVATQKQLIVMIVGGKVDSAIMFDKVAKYTLNKEMLSGYISRGFENHTSDIYVAFSKKFESSKKFSQLLDKGLRNIRKSGLYERLLKNHE